MHKFSFILDVITFSGKTFTHIVIDSELKFFSWIDESLWNKTVQYLPRIRNLQMRSLDFDFPEQIES